MEDQGLARYLYLWIWIQSCKVSSVNIRLRSYLPLHQARLTAHFSPETEAGRLDHPEWLFNTVVELMQVRYMLHDNCIRLTNGAIGIIEELSPALRAHQVHS